MAYSQRRPHHLSSYQGYRRHFQLEFVVIIIIISAFLHLLLFSAIELFLFLIGS